MNRIVVLGNNSYYNNFHLTLNIPDNLEPIIDQYEYFRFVQVIILINIRTLTC